MRLTSLLFLAVFLPQCLPGQDVSEDVTRRTLHEGNLILEDIPEIPASLEESVNRYENIRSATFVDWARDSQSLYVSTRFGEVNQLHWVQQAGGARRQMTFYSEPVGQFARRPGGQDLAFTMDAGGNEFAQIYLFDPGSGLARLLTDGESRNGAVLWNRQGTQLVYRSTRRNGRSNDLWIMDPARPEEASLLWPATDGSYWSPVDWREDDQVLLVQQYVHNQDSRVHLIRIEDRLSRLWEGGNEETPSINMAVGFGDGGQGLFLVTNQDSDFNRLAYAPEVQADLRILTEDIPWNVDDAKISQDRRRLAFTVNEDGWNHLYLLDTKSLEYRQVEGLPQGLIGSMGFSPDGRKLALTLNTARTPSDVFVLSLGRRATDYDELTRWTFSEVGGLDVSRFVEPELIHYQTFDERFIPAFVYRPAGEGPFPVVIYIHGGPEGQYRPGFSGTFQMWVDQLGAAVVAPNVRGSSGYGKEYLQLDNGYQREDSVKDIGALLDWLKDQPYLDATRVAVYGGSYGGYMVLASAMYYSERLSAAIDMVGISNFVTFLENTQAYRRDLRRAEYGDERDPLMRAFLEKISPSRQVERITVPLLVAQGQNDPRVPVTESEQIVRALREQGREVWYMNALNEGHGFRKKENRDTYGQVVLMFLRKHLK